MYQAWAAAAGTRWSFTAKFAECWKFESGNYRSINDKLFPAFPQMGLNKGWYTDDIHFEGEGGNAKIRCYQTSWVDGWGIRECSGRPVFIFLLLKKIWFAPWPNVMLSETLIYYCMYSILDWLIFCWGNLIVQKRKWKW